MGASQNSEFGSKTMSLADGEEYEEYKRSDGSESETVTPGKTCNIRDEPKTLKFKIVGWLFT